MWPTFVAGKLFPLARCSVSHFCFLIQRGPSKCVYISLNLLDDSFHICARKPKVFFPPHISTFPYWWSIISTICSGWWLSFTLEAVALRTHADNSWINIMALSTAITDREVIGFTNQPWLWVYRGIGLCGSYFTDWCAVCQRRLGGNEKLVQGSSGTLPLPQAKIRLDVIFVLHNGHHARLGNLRGLFYWHFWPRRVKQSRTDLHLH